jgi:hypothetical protein
VELVASAQDLGAKLAAEGNVSITTRDIARYMIGLDGTDHVRAALEGKSVNLPPPRATETVTSNVTTFDYLVCNFCRKKWGEVDHMLIIAGRKAHGVVAVCNECSPDEENTTGEQADDVTDDVTQDDTDELAERRRAELTCLYCGKPQEQFRHITEVKTKKDGWLFNICTECSVRLLCGIT